MTPQERFSRIKDITGSGSMPQYIGPAALTWLITRIEQLTDTLLAVDSCLDSECGFKKGSSLHMDIKEILNSGPKPE